MGANAQECCGNEVYCKECPEWNGIIDGEKEIIDGEKEIIDGEKEIIDGEKEIIDGEKEIIDGEKEIIDGEKEIIDGEKEIIGQVTLVLTDSGGSQEKSKSPNNQPFDTNEGNALWHLTN